MARYEVRLNVKAALSGRPSASDELSGDGCGWHIRVQRVPIAPSARAAIAHRLRRNDRERATARRMRNR